jgi:ferredoxin
MVVKKAYAVYFSPTGTTEKAVIACAEGTGLLYEKIDLTLLKTRQAYKHYFSKNELIIVGMPVYGGRLPGNLDDFFSGLKGNDTPAVALVMYGNREYDDALIELKIRLEGCGFNVIAGAAFIGEHTMNKKIATGRPDKRDLEIAKDFGKKTLDAIEKSTPSKLTVKGNYPFIARGFNPAARGPLLANVNVITIESCTHCGLCAENCPWGAIDMSDFEVINSSKCSLCARCIKNCPVNAKTTKSDEKTVAFMQAFEKRFSATHKEPELFLPQ